MCIRKWRSCTKCKRITNDWLRSLTFINASFECYTGKYVRVFLNTNSVVIVSAVGWLATSRHFWVNWLRWLRWFRWHLIVWHLVNRNSVHTWFCWKFMQILVICSLHIYGPLRFQVRSKVVFIASSIFCTNFSTYRHHFRSWSWESFSNLSHVRAQKH